MGKSENMAQIPLDELKHLDHPVFGSLQIVRQSPKSKKTFKFEGKIHRTLEKTKSDNAIVLEGQKPAMKFTRSDSFDCKFPGVAHSTSLSRESSIEEECSRRRVSHLVDELLLDIYGKWYNNGMGLRRHSSNSSAHESDSCSASWKLQLYRSSHIPSDAQQKSRLMNKKSVPELVMLLARLGADVQYAGAVLARQLKRRDALISRREKQNDVITATLQAMSEKRSQDTKIRFSVMPAPGDSGFTQWHEAMKMVARLPGGIPPEFRRRLWLTLAEKHLQERAVDWKHAERFCFNEWSNPDDDELGVQIVKDLHRTGCSLFCGAAAEENQALLKRVLLAYARWNKAVGYCQGFNMLAALILQVMDRSETDSVKVMIYLIEGVLPESYFANNLRGLSVDMAVFRDLLRLRLPTLSRHLEQLQHEARDSATGTSYEPPLTNVFTMQWFLTLFSNCLPQSTVLRVWDLIFLEGNEVLLRTALAIWDGLADRIMAVESADEFYSIMGVLTREMLEFGLMDTNNLVKTIVTIAPFPFPELPELRDKYMYNITPWTQTVSTAARRGLKLFHSDDDDDEDGTDEDDEKIAVAATYGISAVFRSTRRRDSMTRAASPSSSLSTLNFTPPVSDRDRLVPVLDITALKQQYMKLRERQRQAHIIFTAACARQPLGPSAPNPVAMNHLLLGKTALLSVRGAGPPPGAVPPPRTPALKSHRGQLRLKPACDTPGGETIHWKDMKKQQRRGSQQQDDDEVIPEKEIPVIKVPESKEDDEDDNVSDDSKSSTSTELCDEPDRMSDFDSEEPTSVSDASSYAPSVTGEHVPILMKIPSPIKSEIPTPETVSPLREELMPEKVSPLREKPMPERVSPLKDELMSERVSPLREKPMPETVSPLKEDLMSERVSPLKELMPERVSPITEKSMPEIVSPLKEKPMPPRVSPLSEKPMPERVSPLTEKPLPEIVSPLKEEPMPQRVSPLKEKPMPPRVSPLSEKPMPERVSPLREKPMPETVSPLKEDLMPERVSPLIELMPERVSPLIELMPERISPLTEKPMPEIVSPLKEEFMPQRVSPLTEKTMPEIVSPLKDELMLERVSPLREKPMPERVSPLKDELMPDRVSPLTEKPIPERVSPLKEELMPQRVSPLTEKSLPEIVSPLKEEPIPQRVSPLSEKPIPEGVSPLNDELMPERVSPLREQPMPQTVSPLKEDLMPERVSPLTELMPEIISPLTEKPMPEIVSPLKEELMPQRVLPLTEKPMPDIVSPLKDELMVERVSPLREKPMPERVSPLKDELMSERVSPLREKLMPETVLPLKEEPMLERVSPLKEDLMPERVSPLREKHMTETVSLLREKSIPETVSPLKEELMPERVSPLSEKHMPETISPRREEVVKTPFERQHKKLPPRKTGFESVDSSLCLEHDKIVNVSPPVNSKEEMTSKTSPMPAPSSAVMKAEILKDVDSVRTTQLPEDDDDRALPELLHDMCSPQEPDNGFTSIKKSLSTHDLSVDKVQVTSVQSARSVENLCHAIPDIQVTGVNKVDYAEITDLLGLDPSLGRRNSERALQIIQENSEILQRIMQCQVRRPSKLSEEDSNCGTTTAPSEVESIPTSSSAENVDIMSSYAVSVSDNAGTSDSVTLTRADESDVSSFSFLSQDTLTIDTRAPVSPELPTKLDDRLSLDSGNVRSADAELSPVSNKYQSHNSALEPDRFSMCRTKESSSYSPQFKSNDLVETAYKPFISTETSGKTDLDYFDSPIITSSETKELKSRKWNDNNELKAEKPFTDSHSDDSSDLYSYAKAISVRYESSAASPSDSGTFKYSLGRSDDYSPIEVVHRTSVRQRTRPHSTIISDLSSTEYLNRSYSSSSINDSDSRSKASSPLTFRSSLNDKSSSRRYSSFYEYDNPLKSPSIYEFERPFKTSDDIQDRSSSVKLEDYSSEKPHLRYLSSKEDALKSKISDDSHFRLPSPKRDDCVSRISENSNFRSSSPKQGEENSRTSGVFHFRHSSPARDELDSGKSDEPHFRLPSPKQDERVSRISEKFHFRSLSPKQDEENFHFRHSSPSRDALDSRKSDESHYRSSSSKRDERVSKVSEICHFRSLSPQQNEENFHFRNSSPSRDALDSRKSDESHFRSSSPKRDECVSRVSEICHFRSSSPKQGEENSKVPGVFHFRHSSPTRDERDSGKSDESPFRSSSPKRDERVSRISENFHFRSSSPKQDEENSKVPGVFHFRHSPTRDERDSGKPHESHFRHSSPSRDKLDSGKSDESHFRSSSPKRDERVSRVSEICHFRSSSPKQDEENSKVPGVLHFRHSSPTRNELDSGKPHESHFRHTSPSRDERDSGKPHESHFRHTSPSRDERDLGKPHESHFRHTSPSRDERDSGKPHESHFRLPSPKRDECVSRISENFHIRSLSPKQDEVNSKTPGGFHFRHSSPTRDEFDSRKSSESHYRHSSPRRDEYDTVKSHDTPYRHYSPKQSEFVSTKRDDSEISSQNSFLTDLHWDLPSRKSKDINISLPAIKSNLSSPTRCKTKFDPFPPRPSVRQPKELGIKLGLYTPESRKT